MYDIGKRRTTQDSQDAGGRQDHSRRSIDPVTGSGRWATRWAWRPSSDSRFLRVQVTDLDSGKAKVNVTIPIGLVNVGLRMAERFAPEFEGFDTGELEELITSGAIGRMVEVVDEEDRERVEVYVE
jgi:hypothetical protein